MRGCGELKSWGETGELYSKRKGGIGRDRWAGVELWGALSEFGLLCPLWARRAPRGGGQMSRCACSGGLGSHWGGARRFGRRGLIGRCGAPAASYSWWKVDFRSWRAFYCVNSLKFSEYSDLLKSNKN